jgi:F-type H+-transporting ATPase subunit gamma
MSGSIETLREKIADAGEFRSVVRAMKALAASNITQYESAVKALVDYTDTIELALAACLRHVDLPATAQERTAGRAQPAGAIIFGSDQGLIGRFNEALVEFAGDYLGGIHGDGRTVWAVGERIHALVVDAGMARANLLGVPTSVHAITSLVGRILVAVEEARERGELGRVRVFHNHPRGGASYGPSGRRLLPLDQVWRDRWVAAPWPTRMLPEVMDGRARALPEFIRSHLFMQLFQACAESLASENASRLAAMQRAETNIEEMLESLGREFHVRRQEEIDQELFDVISAFEARRPSRGTRPD